MSQVSELKKAGFQSANAASLSQSAGDSNYRILPQNLEAEQGLLGTLLIDNRTYEKIGDFLKPEHFLAPAHQRIYQAVRTLIDRGQTASPVTLKTFFDKDELDWKGDLQLHEFYKVLIEQRKKISVDAEILFISNDKKLLAFKRNSKQNDLLVFLNLDSSTISVNYENHEAFSFENIFNTTEVINQSLIQFDLLPGDFKVYNRI
jgi:glycosidase